MRSPIPRHQRKLLTGFDVVIEADGTQFTLGHVEAPWAVDADGTRLATSYSLDGGTLTQHVNTTGAAYPIVTDPAVTVGVGADGPGVYWNMYGYQAKAIQAATVSAVALALAVGSGLHKTSTSNCA